jgi:hypothetical protein
MRSPPARGSRSPCHGSAGHRLFSLCVTLSRREGWSEGFGWDDKKNVNKLFLRKPEGKRPLGRTSEKLHNNIGLKCVLRKQTGRVWNGFVWLRINTSGTSRTYSNEIIRLLRRFKVTSCLHCLHEPNVSQLRLRQHVLPKRWNKLIIPTL